MHVAIATQAADQKDATPGRHSRAGSPLSPRLRSTLLRMKRTRTWTTGARGPRRTNACKGLCFYWALGSSGRGLPVVERCRQNIERLVLAMVGDSLLSSLDSGALLDLVAYVTHTDIQGASLRTLWHSEHCRCRGTFISGQVVTLYGVQYMGQYGSTHHLQRLPATTVVPRPALDAQSYLSFKEVCAGLGGMTQGCAMLGGHCVALQDISPLACETLRKQGVEVLPGNIENPEVRRAFHLIGAGSRCLLGASLPGPGPLRGLGSGSLVQSCDVLQSVLQLAWHTQASGLTFQSDLRIMQSRECAQILREFSAKAGYHLAEIVLDLAHQWASCRVR